MDFGRYASLEPFATSTFERVFIAKDCLNLSAMNEH